MSIKKVSNFVPFILLLLLPFITFWQTLHHDFVWDDDVHIIYNSYDTPDASHNILKYWSPKPKLIYAPITYTVWGMLKNGLPDPYFFHFTNIIVHTLAVIIIFFILKIMVKNEWPALAGALIFAVHPLQVEAVAWATGLRTLLCGLFGMMSLLLHLLFRERKQPVILYLLGLVAFFLALASKPTAVIFLIFILLIDLIYFKKRIRDMAMHFIPYGLLTLPFLWILIQTNTPPEYSAPLWSRPLIMTDTITFYLKKLFYPVELCSFYGRTPAYVMQEKWFYVSWIIPAVITWLLIKSYKKTRFPLLCALLFLAGILPVSGLISFEGQNWNTVADRYLYFSMLGIALSFSLIINKWRQKKLIWIIAGGIILGCFFRSYLVQIPQWQNDWTIWNSAIHYFPDQSVPYSKRGELYLAQGKLNMALYDFQRAVQRNPRFAKAYNNIGLVYSNQEKWDEALEAYSYAIHLNPKLTKTLKNIGLIYYIQKNYEKAEQAFKTAIKYDPDYADAYYQLGRTYYAQKMINEAERAFLEAIKLDPGHLKAYMALANVYTAVGNDKNAAAIWQTVQALDPGNQQALEYFKPGIKNDE